MRRRTAVSYPALALAIFLGGCVQSVHPVVPEAEATFDERLVGTWEEADGSDVAVVRRGSGNSYVIDYTTNGKTSPLGARLGRIGEHTVLDVWPLTRASDHEDLPWSLMAPVHLMVAIRINTDAVELSLLEGDSLAAVLESGALRLDHQAIDQRLILSNPTQELRSAMRTFLARPGALAKPDTFRRRGRAGT